MAINDVIEFADVVDIDDGRAFGPAIFVSVRFGVEDGVWLGDGGGVGEGMVLFSGDGIASNKWLAAQKRLG